MTINEILNLLEENYEEIDVFDHIKEWSTEIAIGYRTYALCTFVNKPHECIIQTMVWYPADESYGIEDSPIYQTYIGYTEDPNNIIHKAFRYKEDSGKQPLGYSIYSTLQEDMGWADEFDKIEEQEPKVEENISEAEEA